MAANSQILRVLVLDTDRLCGAMITETVRNEYPTSQVDYEADPATAAASLTEGTIDLMVVAVRGFDLDVITLLGVWAEHDVDRTRVLVIAPTGNSSALLALQTLPIHGVFDSAQGDLHELELACRVVGRGGTYFSKTVRLKMERSARARSSARHLTADQRAMIDLQVPMPTTRLENTNVPKWRRTT